MLSRRGMNLNDEQLWERFQRFYSEFPSTGLALDLSRTQLDSDYIHKMTPALQSAFAAMDQLEAGAVANPDEKRMVGHYWLRNAALAPKPEIRREIEGTLAATKSFAHQVHSGALQ